MCRLQEPSYLILQCRLGIVPTDAWVGAPPLPVTTHRAHALSAHTVAVLVAAPNSRSQPFTTVDHTGPAQENSDIEAHLPDGFAVSTNFSQDHQEVAELLSRQYLFPLLP